MTRPILQFERVGIAYPGAAEGAAVRGVSLELAPGDDARAGWPKAASGRYVARVWPSRALLTAGSP